jgi:GNAT superfamily N-acetyltransferase
MGEETTLAFDRSPDFFARSKPYEHHTLLVAEAGDAVVGVGGVALKPLRAAGELLKAAYFYDLRVDPAFRRLGVASAIADGLRGLVKRMEADFTYALVLEGNVPSLELVAKRGSRPVRRCVLAILPAGGTGGAGRWRPLEQQDLSRVTILIEMSFPRHDLFPLFDVAAFRGLLKRTPGFSLRACYGMTVGGTLSACFGLWDYSSIMRIRVGRNRRKEHTQRSWLIEAEEIAPHFLLPLAFQGPGLLAEVIQQARGLLVGQRRGQIIPALLIPYDPEDRGFAAVRQFERFELGIKLFARSARRELRLGDRPLYLDPIDL